MTAPAAFLCFVCNKPMMSLGVIPVRVGGTSGGWHLVFGEWADVGEKTLSIEMYRCNQCRRVDMYDLELSLPIAESD